MATVTAAVVLILANAMAVLPAQWVFGHLAVGRAFLHPFLDVHVDPEKPGTFRLLHPEDNSSASGSWISPFEAPPNLSRFYDRLRTDTAARHSRIRFRARDVRTRQVYESEILHSIDYWRPNDESRFRFVVNQPLDLPPGKFWVDVHFYADPPYGPGFEDRNSSALSPIGSVLPGRNILIERMWAFPVTVVVAEKSSTIDDHGQ